MTSLNYLSLPVDGLNGEIHVPGDKSISHRAVIFGAIAKGKTTVKNFLEGEDCIATLQAIEKMGVRVERYPSQLIVHGVGKNGLRSPCSAIDCGNSGTSIRLLSGLLSAQAFDSKLIGDKSLSQRPMNRIAHPLGLMGAKVITTTKGCAPIQIRGGQKLKGITYDMPTASAQVKSCLLLAGLYAEGKTTIVEPDLTRDHSERILDSMGYPMKKEGKAITLSSSSDLTGIELPIPGDLSSAAFFIVAATITPGSSLKIKDVGINPTRMGLIEILNRMGANIQVSNQRLYGAEPVADLHIHYAPLKGMVIPQHLVSLAIDEFPVLFIAAATAKGDTILSGAQELRLKESDRIGAMAEGLIALGVDAQTTLDGIRIKGGSIKGGTVNSYDDHRVAMAFSIAGAVAKTAISIKNCESIATSFPNFLKTATECGLKIASIHSPTSLEQP